ncbi:hypothetical protein FRB99_001966 [Tulasnella sp. 403]|nr:hypothetical protein FRB99_001966 [Tulasnella sp. 403]
MQHTTLPASDWGCTVYAQGTAGVAEAQNAIPYAFNLDRPPLRDGFSTLPATTAASWLVIRYEVLQLGVVFLHCYINNHATSGMDVALVEGNPYSMDIPQYYRAFNLQVTQTGSQTKIRNRALVGLGAGPSFPVWFGRRDSPLTNA